MLGKMTYLFDPKSYLYLFLIPALCITDDHDQTYLSLRKNKFFRGNALMKAKRWKTAIADFQLCIKYK